VRYDRVVRALVLLTVVSCSDPAPIAPLADAASAPDTGVLLPDASPGRGDAGLPPFCAGKTYALCEDFESGRWLPAFSPTTTAGGTLLVTEPSDPIARALRARAPGSGAATLTYPVDVQKGATLAFALRVSAIAGEVSILRLSLRKDSMTEIVLRPYPELPRAVAYLVHREPGMPENRAPIANFIFDRFVEVSVTLPRLGVAQPLHAVIGNDLSAVSFLVSEPSDAPAFSIGIAAATEPSEVVVDDVSLDYVR
jgi:hypothetical protein